MVIRKKLSLTNGLPRCKVAKCTKFMIFGNLSSDRRKPLDHRIPQIQTIQQDRRLIDSGSNVVHRLSPQSLSLTRRQPSRCASFLLETVYFLRNPHPNLTSVKQCLANDSHQADRPPWKCRISRKRPDVFCQISRRSYFQRRRFSLWRGR